MNLSRLIPPLFLKPIVRWKTGASLQRYTSHEEAARHCGKGYDSEVIAKLVATKTALHTADTGPLTHPATLRVGTAIGMARTGDTMNVLDFGGGAGSHYFDAKRLFPSLRFRWFIVETIAAAQAGKPLENGELAFFDDAAAAVQALRAKGGIDLAFSSGTLQCIPSPREWLRWFVGLGAASLALVRVHLVEGAEDVINIQRAKLSNHGSGPLPAGFTDGVVAYPFTFCSRNAVAEIIQARYEVILRTEEDEQHLLSDALTYGFYCRRR